LRAALDVLDSRTITCISGRVLNIYKANSDPKDPDNDFRQEWWLVNVWRGYDPSKN